MSLKKGESLKTPKHCDLDLDNWKQYIGDITTNARWLSTNSDNPIFGNWFIPKRNNLPTIPASVKSHHGLWISEIPYQMIQRFTKKGETIWSVFGGTGIDYDIAKYLGRNCIINDLEPKRSFIQQGDSRTFNPNAEIKMALIHPPYWDIVKYTDNENDGSNKKTLKEFLQWWEEIVDNVDKYIIKDGYIILACGNIYKNSEEIELGELLKYIVLKKGYILKQHIIKDYGETKGSSAKNYNLNYYRQLKGGYGNFYGDNIYILKKQKSKNKITEILKEFI
jgi:DNA modification methylase